MGNAHRSILSGQSISSSSSCCGPSRPPSSVPLNGSHTPALCTDHHGDSIPVHKCGNDASAPAQAVRGHASSKLIGPTPISYVSRALSSSRPSRARPSSCQ